MNILCPSCHVSIPVSDTDPLLRCESCGLTTDLSRIGTYPGGAPVPMARDLTDETIGGCKIAELIGVGGMGVVYRAERTADGTEVAVKVLHESYAWKREEFVARFAREARALARLEHPGIVRILDSGRQDEIYYLVTEYVSGADLGAQLRSQRLDLEEIVDIMVQVCDAITYAHRCGVVHRDIKPANIMVDQGQVKVLDFGLAQIAGGETHLSSLTRTDLAMGTFNYLSPEQRTNAKQVDERSDVFSLGVVFFEMLTGTLPLGNFPPPSRIRPEVGKRSDRVVAKSLSAAPADRYASVAEMAADIRLIGQGRSRSRPALVAALAGASGVAAAIAVALIIGATQASEDVDIQQSLDNEIDQAQQALGSVKGRRGNESANEQALQFEDKNLAVDPANQTNNDFEEAPQHQLKEIANQPAVVKPANETVKTATDKTGKKKKPIKQPLEGKFGKVKPKYKAPAPTKNKNSKGKSNPSGKKKSKYAKGKSSDPLVDELLGKGVNEEASAEDEEASAEDDAPTDLPQPAANKPNSFDTQPPQPQPQPQPQQQPAPSNTKGKKQIKK